MLSVREVKETNAFVHQTLKNGPGNKAFSFSESMESKAKKFTAKSLIKFIKPLENFFHNIILKILHANVSPDQYDPNFKLLDIVGLSILGKYKGALNCEGHAALGFTKLAKKNLKGRVDFVELWGNDDLENHFLNLVNLNADATLGDPSTWAKDTIIFDAYHDDAVSQVRVVTQKNTVTKKMLSEATVFENPEDIRINLVFSLQQGLSYHQCQLIIRFLEKIKEYLEVVGEEVLSEAEKNSGLDCGEKKAEIEQLKKIIDEELFDYRRLCPFNTELPNEPHSAPLQKRSMFSLRHSMTYDSSLSLPETRLEF